MRSSHQPKIVVVVPTYNEKETISDLISSIVNTLPLAEIIVIDDKSPDGTSLVVKKLARINTRIFLINGGHKNGRGKAVVQGFKTALDRGADIVVEMDADGSHRVEELPAMISHVTKHRVVIASRYITGGAIYNWSWQRHIFSRAANWLISCSLHLGLHDNTNGFRAYHKHVIALLLRHKMSCNSFLVLSETAAILRSHNIALLEIPSNFINRTKGRSNTSVVEIKNNLIELMQIFVIFFRKCSCGKRI